MNAEGDLDFKAIFRTKGETIRIITTNYKVDFLLATIGGCVMFYFIVFGWIGKLYNNYKLRAKMAEELYA